MKQSGVAQFKDRLREERERRKLGVNELARLAGVPGITISRYESGGRENPDLGILIRISNLLGVHPLYLLGSSDDPNPNKPFEVEPGPSCTAAAHVTEVLNKLPPELVTLKTELIRAISDELAPILRELRAIRESLSPDSAEPAHTVPSGKASWRDVAAADRKLLGQFGEPVAMQVSLDEALESAGDAGERAAGVQQSPSRGRRRSGKRTA